MTSLQKATTKVTKEMLFIFIPFVRFVSFVVKPSCSGLNHGTHRRHSTDCCGHLPVGLAPATGRADNH
jgi:hypothetical protein